MKKLPFVKCKGLCQSSCSAVPCTLPEAEKLGPLPAEGWAEGDELTCAWLGKDGRCSTYETRPLVCRLFGAVQRMECPHGCRPRRWPRKRHELRWCDKVWGESGGVVILTAKGAVPAEELLETMKRERR